MADLVIDCSYGISGDMLVGALLDLGADKTALIKALSSLDLDNYDIKIRKINKKGTPSTDFEVELKENNFDHNMNYLYGNQETNLKIKHKRNLPIIKEIINNSNISQRAKILSIKIFELVATAEAKAHKIAIDDVIFHETGAMDSIIDIVSIAICIDSLEIDNVYVKNLREGKGKIRTRVGLLPIPTPAVMNVLMLYNQNIEIIDYPYELITPTGISALAILSEFKTISTNYKVNKIGYGAGKREYDLPCTLKIEMIEKTG